MIQEFFPVLDAVPMGHLWVLLIVGLILMMAWMTALWFWHYRLQNAGVVDFGWTLGLGILALVYAFLGDGYGPRRFLIATLVVLWSSRLAWQILKDRILGNKPEEPRYAEIRERWQPYFGLRLFLYFEWKAFLAILFSAPFALLAIDPLNRITGFEWAGLLLWTAGFAGQSIARSQRRIHDFFEWLIWVGYFIAALATPYGLWTILCPLLMLGKLRRVT